MRVLSAADVRSALDLPPLVEAIEASFRAHARGVLPPPERLDSYLDRGELHVKAGHVPGYFAVKANSAYFDNPPARPAIQGVILLYDASDGVPVAVADSGVITALRTAAASAVAARLLARPDATRLGLLGAGAQAWQHALAMSTVRPLEQVTVWSRRTESAEHLAQQVRHGLGVDVDVVATPGEAARADIVVTCTPTTTPLLDRGQVGAGTFVAAVGADSPHKQELTSGLTAAAAVVPDVVQQCLAAGELHHAVAAGLMTADDVVGELGALLEAGHVTDPDRPVVFDSTGTGFQDAAAMEVLLSTLPADVGLEVQLGETRDRE